MLSSKRFVVTLKVKIAVNGHLSKSKPQAVVFVWSRHFIYRLSWSVFLLSFSAIFCTGILLGISLALQCTNWACAVKSCQFSCVCVWACAWVCSLLSILCVCAFTFVYFRTCTWRVHILGHMSNILTLSSVIKRGWKDWYLLAGEEQKQLDSSPQYSKQKRVPTKNKQKKKNTNKQPHETELLPHS